MSKKIESLLSFSKIEVVRNLQKFCGVEKVGKHWFSRTAFLPAIVIITSTSLRHTTTNCTSVSVFGVLKRPVPQPHGPEQPVYVRSLRLCNLTGVHRRFRFDVFLSAHKFNVIKSCTRVRKCFSCVRSVWRRKNKNISGR